MARNVLQHSIIYSYVRVHKNNNTNHLSKLPAIENVKEEN